MLENILLITTAIATCFAAISTWYSYKVSENSLFFQKSYAKNQNLINDINRVIIKVEIIQTILVNIIESTDDEFISIENLIVEVKQDIKRLSVRKIIKYQDFRIFSTNFHVTDDITALEEIIEILEEKKSEIFN